MDFASATVLAEVLFFIFVCLFVCLFVNTMTQKIKVDFYKFWGISRLRNKEKLVKFWKLF